MTSALTAHIEERPGPSCPKCGKTMDLDHVVGDVARWSCRCATMTIVPCPKCTEPMGWPEGADAPTLYDACDECEAHVNCVSIADSNEAIEIVQRERDEARARVAQLELAMGTACDEIMAGKHSWAHGTLFSALFTVPSVERGS